MARTTSRRSAPARAPAQSRSASTAAAPAYSQPHPQQHAAAHPPAAQASQGPGLFGQMAATAGGVAVGSTVGHVLGAGITLMFGGSSLAPVQQQAQAAPVQQEGQRACDADARNFTRCLEDNQGNMQICDYYLQQLKACQLAASIY